MPRAGRLPRVEVPRVGTRGKLPRVESSLGGLSWKFGEPSSLACTHGDVPRMGTRGEFPRAEIQKHRLIRYLILMQRYSC